MSKGSLYWGKAKGKLGETVLSVVKGQQVTRSYNAKIANPKTYAQMRQRSKLANCVKFYKQVSKGYFQFAYDDKKPLESDYNAFMRHNVNAGTILNRAMVKDANFPAFGSFMVSRGPLGEIRLTEDAQEGWYGLPVIGEVASEGLNTVADFTKDVLNSYPNLREGDIVTVFVMFARVTAGNNTQLMRFVGQFKLDKEDSTKTFNFHIQGKDEGSRIWTLGERGWNNENAFIVFSRPQADGSLLCSTSFSTPSLEFGELIGQETESERLESWEPSAEAILKGSLLNINS